MLAAFFRIFDISRSTIFVSRILVLRELSRTLLSTWRRSGSRGRASRLGNFSSVEITHPWPARRCSGRGNPRSDFVDGVAISSSTRVDLSASALTPLAHLRCRAAFEDRLDRPNPITYKERFYVDPLVRNEIFNEILAL